MKKRSVKKEKNNKNSLKHFAKKELRKEQLEKKLIFFFLLLTIISSSVLFLSFVADFTLTGYAGQIASKAGVITEIEIYHEQSTVHWVGVYGLVFRVPGFSIPPEGTFTAGEVVRKDMFFSCLQNGITGGNEVFASTSDSINFDNLQPADLSEIDAFMGCSGGNDCASNTFTDTSEVYIGTTRIANIPTFYSYRVYGEGNRSMFDLGALTDGTNLVYVTHVENIETLYNASESWESEVINFQAMLPTAGEGNEIYYFFRDPNDECPDEDIDQVIVVTINGTVYDAETNNTISDAEILLPGGSCYSYEDGLYGSTIYISPGNYTIFAQKEGYKNYFSNLTISESSFLIEKDIYLEAGGEESGTPLTATITGQVTNEAGIAMDNVSIYFDDQKTETNSTGGYTISSDVIEGFYTIVFYKTGYGIETAYVNLTEENSTQEINIEMAELNSNLFENGPFPTKNDGEDDPGEGVRDIAQTAEDYWISTKAINKKIMKGTFEEETVGIYNAQETSIDLSFELSDSLSDFVNVESARATINPHEFYDLVITIYGTPEAGTYNGTLTIRGDLEETVSIQIEVVDQKYPIEFLLVDVSAFGENIKPGENLKYKVLLQNLLRDQNYDVEITTRLKDLNDSIVYSTDNFESEISTSKSFIREIEIPENATTGDYSLEVEAKYLNFFTTSTLNFMVYKPIYLYTFFGIPVWGVLVAISFMSFIALNLLVYHNYQKKKKRYQISVDKATLADKDTERAVRVGNLAESKTPAYYEIDKLTTHAIVSGGTGMGKSISAQVLIEECLKKDVCVMVFDPTAQWSGMLRKCTDKKMLGLYPKFGLKPQDAQAFKGNVRMIKNHKQKMDINKYFAPGQIQIFSMNKMSPAEIDIFVANFIKQIFRSDPKESPILKTLLVFDEVHRLLPKFGGSGAGFLQIERSCREFRKWGLGVMLISQVMKDFVGEIKANINTELQARTLEEGDLDRIKTKYGDEFLKSLVKAEIGVIMFQNADYNRGRPYFINFRPILHNTRRLEDEELEKYNQYNDQVEDLEFQIDELEKEKVDVFDFKMELKLVKDKIMSGSFSVVEIYLDGLKPRVQKEWEKLGKKAPERKIELVSDEEMAAEDAKTKTEATKAAPAPAPAAPAPPKEDSPKPEEKK